MNIITQHISFSGTELILTNQRVLFWKEHQALILCDLHLGKPAHFRKHGIALPTQVALQDLYRLEQLIHHFAAKKVIVVGDLIHAGANTEVDLLQVFIADHPQTRFILIKGNHDRFSDMQWQKIGIQEIQSCLQLDAISFLHHPPVANEKPTISGHVHPGVRIQMPTKGTITLPCYIVGPQQLILPAFSLFTGFHTRSVPKGAVRYAFHDSGIFCV